MHHPPFSIECSLRSVIKSKRKGCGRLRKRGSKGRKKGRRQKDGQWKKKRSISVRSRWVDVMLIHF